MTIFWSIESAKLYNNSNNNNNNNNNRNNNNNHNHNNIGLLPSLKTGN